jgi:hypothetical protein
VIQPPETPAEFILFLNRQMNQQMRSAFFVFDLVGGNTGLEIKCRLPGRSLRDTLTLAPKKPIGPDFIFEIGSVNGGYT